jgi:hypothetical protein
VQKRSTTVVLVFLLTAIKLSFSASVLIVSSKTFAWFLSSTRERKRERERERERERRGDMHEREGVLFLVNEEIRRYCMTFETSFMKVNRFVEKEDIHRLRIVVRVLFPGV